MKYFHTLLAIISFFIAIFIFIYASGARRIYSGAFFILIGVIILINDKKLKNKKNNP